jgi:hypothetical protein
MRKQLEACAMIGFALFLAWAINGCSPLERAQQALATGQTLTPEQIQAYDAAGMAVVGCLGINGPPPAGSGSLLVVPKTAAGSIKFSADCHPQSDITLTPSTYKATP